ncbi:MAG: gliding motility-associated C-terminal domain-containing protein [Bacteroidia bacterium]
MNRLEDKFKDAFDHFEPEVDPGVWTKISTQLPSAPASVPGGSSAVKGLVARLGVKGLSAIIAAAAITVTAVYFGVVKQETPVQPVVSGSSVQEPAETAVVSAPVPSQNFDNQIDIKPEANTVNEKTTVVSGTQEQHTQGNSNDRLISPTASTGTTVVASGDAVKSQHPAQPAVSTPKIIDNEPAKSNPAPVQTPVQVNTNPSPVLIVSTTTGFAPFTVTALTNQQGKKADFDFGDGYATGNQFSTSHTYEKPGDYTLQCLVDGITLTREIHVTGTVPSAFSPNGDGINDIFEIENTDGFQLEVKIYTRSGRQVYSAKGDKITWDGRLPDGSVAEPGTYLYDIFATSGDGSSWKQKGSLHLFK